MIYLDTSVVAAWLCNEAPSRAINRWYSSTTEALVGSDWLAVEFSSAVAIKQRQLALKASECRQCWQAFEEITTSATIQLLPVPRAAHRLAAELCRQAKSGLRAGDALHIAMARTVGAKYFFTLDANQAKNARHQGLALVTL